MDNTTTTIDTAQILAQLGGPTRTVRKNIVVVTLLLCWLLIFLIVVMGSPTNTLHTSALSWAFTLQGAVIGGYLFGAVYDNLILAKTTVPTLTTPPATNNK